MFKYKQCRVKPTFKQIYLPFGAHVQSNSTLVDGDEIVIFYYWDGNDNWMKHQLFIYKDGEDMVDYNPDTDLSLGSVLMGGVGYHLYIRPTQPGVPYN